jgi:hypothetical protein
VETPSHRSGKITLRLLKRYRRHIAGLDYASPDTSYLAAQVIELADRAYLKDSPASKMTATSQWQGKRQRAERNRSRADSGPASLEQIASGAAATLSMIGGRERTCGIRLQRKKSHGPIE